MGQCALPEQGPAGAAALCCGAEYRLWEQDRALPWARGGVRQLGSRTAPSRRHRARGMRRGQQLVGDGRARLVRTGVVGRWLELGAEGMPVSGAERARTHEDGIAGLQALH